MTIHFTAHKDPRIDDAIQHHMDIIVEEITNVVKNVDSIVLSGGFGRGEGSIIRLPNDKLVPVNDYDIYVFSNCRAFRDLYYTINNIHERIQVESRNANETTPSMFQVDIQFVRTSKLDRLNPDMSTYDLRTASKVIYGKDLRDRIPVRKGDIPPGAGINPLFLASLGLIQNLEPQYLKSGVPDCKIARFNYECYKVYIAISTALSFLCNSLELWHEKRARLISEVYSDRFPYLAAKLPDLPRKIEYYTNLKLRSLDFSEEKDPLRLWFEAKSDLESVLLYSICTLIRKPLSSIDVPSEFLLRNIRDIDFRFLGPYLSWMLRRKGLPHNTRVIRMLMPIVRLFLDAGYVKNYYNLYKKLFLKPLACPSSPLICVYVAGFILLSSISAGDKRPNRVEVERSGRYFRFLHPFALAGDEFTTWRNARDSCIRVYRILGKEEKIAL
jgi:hypothetical protein